MKYNVCMANCKHMNNFTYLTHYTTQTHTLQTDTHYRQTPYTCTLHIHGHRHRHYRQTRTIDRHTTLVHYTYTDTYTTDRQTHTLQTDTLHMYTTHTRTQTLQTDTHYRQTHYTHTHTTHTPVISGSPIRSLRNIASFLINLSSSFIMNYIKIQLPKHLLFLQYWSQYSN